MGGAETVLFQYGIAGVALLAQGYAIITLYRDNQRLHQSIADLQETRRADAQEVVDKVTKPLEGMSEAVRLMYDKLVISKRGR